MYRKNAAAQRPWVTYILIGINVLVFGVEAALQLMGYGTGILYYRGALYAPVLLKGQGFERLVTSMFLHADAAHLFSNMIVLFAGGDVVEKNLGHGKYFLLYMISGIMGNGASILGDWLTGRYGFSVGASGAVFGVIGALVFMILQGWLRTRGEDPRMKSLLIRAAVMTAWLLYSGWANPQINQAAHIGGLVTGFFMGAALMPRRGRADLRDLY